MVQEFRLSIGQSVEGLALLLGISPEEYQRLEEDWVPPDDFLRKLCSLFHWNYQETLQKIRLSGSGTSQKKPVQAVESKPNSFAEMLRSSREKVGQPPEAIALMLNIQIDDYLEIEAGKTPPDSLLRQICSLFSWNFLQVQRKLMSQSTSAFTTLPIHSKLQRDKQTPPPSLTLEAPESETLGERLAKARENFGQSVEGIALLLNISSDEYMELEQGKMPDAELLKRIAALFRWNHNELKLLTRNANVHQMQPSVTQLQKLQGPRDGKFQTTLADLQKSWGFLSTQEQDMLLTQLEILRDTAQRFSAK